MSTLQLQQQPCCHNTAHNPHVQDDPSVLLRTGAAGMGNSSTLKTLLPLQQLFQLLLLPNIYTPSFPAAARLPTSPNSPQGVPVVTPQLLLPAGAAGMGCGVYAMPLLAFSMSHVMWLPMVNTLRASRSSSTGR